MPLVVLIRANQAMVTVGMIAWMNSQNEPAPPPIISIFLVKTIRGYFFSHFSFIFRKIFVLLITTWLQGWEKHNCQRWTRRQGPVSWNDCTYMPYRHSCTASCLFWSKSRVGKCRTVFLMEKTYVCEEKRTFVCWECLLFIDRRVNETQ